MYKVTSVTSNLPLVLCTDQKYNTWMIYFNCQQVSEDRWEWWAQDFMGLPTLQELKDIVNNYINEEIERKSRQEFVWTSSNGETFNIDFTPQKEYELRFQHGEFPFDYALGKDYQNHTFESNEELEDLFNKFEEFKQSCREEMETIANSIDWSQYEQALENARNN